MFVFLIAALKQLEKEKMAYLSDIIASETDFEETAVYRGKKKVCPEETQNLVGCRLAKKACRNPTKAGPIIPFPGSSTPAKGLTYSNSYPDETVNVFGWLVGISETRTLFPRSPGQKDAWEGAEASIFGFRKAVYY